MSIVLVSVLTLLVIGALSALVIYLSSKKFYLYEDPLIPRVEQVLPAVNCGGCGHTSCHGFALACIKSDSLHNMVCTVGGKAVMEDVAAILGKTASPVIPTVAVVRCGGSCELRPRINQFNGASSCAIVHNLYGGDTGCSWGCIGLGDCVEPCKFDAIKLNPKTLLPEINDLKCTSCNACVTACPKGIIELRNLGVPAHKIYVNCVAKDPAVADACSVACIGCEKCVEVCQDKAITMIGKLAYIDPEACTLCGKCINVCPTNAIVEEKGTNPSPKGE